MLQNASPLRKSAPWPPNISDEHVSCIAHATRNASWQILFKCPTPANVFETATKPARFFHFWEGVEPLAPDTRNDIWTSKSGLRWCKHVVLLTCWLRNVLRATTQQRALFRHLNFQKCSEAGVLCTFWLRHVLRTTTACNFSSLIWPDGSAPAALASLLFENHWKNTVFRYFATFSRTCIFCLLPLSLLWSSFFFSSLLSASAHLCFFICQCCRKFDF